MAYDMELGPMGRSSAAISVNSILPQQSLFMDSIIDPAADKEAHWFRKLLSAVRILRKSRWLKPARRIIFLLLYFTVGVAVYTKFEHWNVGTALSFILVTITTVGFGYNHPTSDGTRLFTVFYMVLGIYSIFMVVSDAAASNFRFANDLLKKKMTTTSEANEEYRHNLHLMIGNVLALVTCVLVASAALSSMEGWSFIESLYFAVQTSTTVGYGDMPIREGYTKLFMGVYLVFSCLLFACAFQNLQQLHARRRQIRKLEYMLHKRKNLNVLTDLDKGEGVTQEQFVLALLLHFGTINYESDVRPWAERFAGLDQAHQGRLFKSDLLQFESEERHGAVEESERLELAAQALTPHLSVPVLDTLRASLSVFPVISPSAPSRQTVSNPLQSAV